MSGNIRSERGDLHDYNWSLSGIEFAAMVGRGFTREQAVALIAAKAGVKRTAIYKRLRKLGALPPYSKRATPDRRVYVELTDEQIQARKVNRDPCLRCGARADIGCQHSPTRSLTGVMFA